MDLWHRVLKLKLIRVRKRIMEKTKKEKKRIYIHSLKLIFHNSITLLLGQSIILLLSIVLLTPSVSSIYRFALSVSGFSHVTVDNIGRFLLNPINFLMAVLLFFIIGLFLLFEIYFLIAFFTRIQLHKKVQFLQILFSSLIKVLYGIVKGNLKLIPFAWMTLLVFNLPLFVFVFSKTRLLRFIYEETPNHTFWVINLLILLVFIVLVFFRRPFVFHYFLLDGMNYKESLKSSKDGGMNRPIRTFFYFVGWNIGIFVIVSAIYAFTITITILLVSATFDQRLAIATFISINESMQNYLSTAIFIISTIGNFALYTQLFHCYQPEEKEIDMEDDLAQSILSSDGSKKYRSIKSILITTAILLMAINIYFFINILRNGSPLDYMNLDSIKVTSHRGFSHSVPENTIPAIEKAIEEQADYVEVDVRVTKDGELVLLHDTSLKRTTGLNEYIWNTDYSEVSALDAGSWMDQSFLGTKIPTLREVFELCKGRIFLNLDLKYRNDLEEIEKKVVELIKEYDMEWQCVISSTSLSSLEKVKKLDSNIQTGYITYQLYSGITKNEGIDFFSMKSNLITKGVLRAIHKEGKELHVWTVNSRTELERLKRLGVDNIITDNPAYVKEVLYHTDSDWYFTTLFKIILE